MGPHERSLQNALSADQNAIRRAQQKLKKSSTFENMNEQEKKSALADIKDEVLEQRYSPLIIVVIFVLIQSRFRQGITADSVKTELQIMLDEQELADQDFVFRQKNVYGNTDSDDDNYWTDIEDDQNGELITDEPDLISSILDATYGDSQLGLSKKTLTKREMQKALKDMDDRKR
jgi:hypothetical protein